MISTHAIENSPAFQTWRESFRQVSGVGVYLLAPATLDADLQKVAKSLNFCRLVSDCQPQCTEDRKKFVRRLKTAGDTHAGPFAMRCFAGLTLTALPVPLADESTAFLTTGPVLLERSGNEPSLEFVVRRMLAAGCSHSEQRIRENLHLLPVRNRREFKAIIVLLRLLAAQLSHMSRQMNAPLGKGWNDAVTVRRARDIIDRRYKENLPLDIVAEEIGVSYSYLSHLFSRNMGLTFTEYLSGRRVIELKNLLTASRLSITDAIFAAGFQSVSQANRVFRAATGTSPRKFRSVQSA